MDSTVAAEAVDRVLLSEVSTFSSLVRIAGLDPKEDLVGGDFQDVDFGESDLSGFDFSYSDLRGAKWENARVDDSTRFDFALFGDRKSPISSFDYTSLHEAALSSRTWSERFFSFAAIIDAFGVTQTQVGLAKDIISGEKSVYSCLCCATYAAATILKQDQARFYCRTMADDSNSRINMFRMKKLLRLANDLERYAVGRIRADDYPKKATPDDAQSLIAFALERYHSSRARI